MYKIVVCGGRDFCDYELMSQKLDLFFSNMDKAQITIVSGCAKGADSFAIVYAEQHGYQILRMPADWNKFGKSAGYRRNEAMAKIATHIVAFHDDKSSGTKHMINLAIERQLPLKVVHYN